MHPSTILNLFPRLPVLSCHEKNVEDIRISALKESVVNRVKGLPENVTLDEIMAEIYFKTQVDAGLKELDEGRGLSHEEVQKRMSRWLTA